MTGGGVTGTSVTFGTVTAGSVNPVSTLGTVSVGKLITSGTDSCTVSGTAAGVADGVAAPAVVAGEAGEADDGGSL